MLRWMVLGVIAASATIASAPAAAAPPQWQLAGKTYNSVAFVDMSSVSGKGASKQFTAMRVSGQPGKDGWSTVVQKLSVNCDTRIFIDAGSRIEKPDSTAISYPGIGATQRAVSSGVFFDLFELVCAGRPGLKVADPKSWTLRNFKPGQ